MRGGTIITIAPNRPTTPPLLRRIPRLVIVAPPAASLYTPAITCDIFFVGSIERLIDSFVWLDSIISQPVIRLIRSFVRSNCLHYSVLSLTCQCIFRKKSKK